MEQLQEFTGIKADTYDEFKKEFKSEFIRKANAHKDPDLKNQILGARAGELMTITRREFKNAGVELPGEVKDKKLEDVMEMGFEKLRETHEAKLQEYESKLGDNDFAKEREEYENKLQKWQKKAESFESRAKKVQSEFEEFKTTIEQKETQRKLDDFFNGALNQAPFKKDITPIEKRGFVAEFKDKYKLDFDENEEPTIYDKEGNPIPNEDKADSFLGINDVLQKELVQTGLHKKNPHANSDKQNKNFNFTKPDEPGKDGRKLHPSAQKATAGK